jgi:hypothetical protein
MVSDLIKAKDENGKWIVYLEASTESKDQEGEKTIMKALEEEAPNYLHKGVVSWDHQHRANNDPGAIIGEPLDVSFSSSRKTLLKAFLYQKNKKAQDVWDNIQSGCTRFGASIGGYILRKSKGIISKVIWRDTAITDKPVNHDTFGKVQLMPFAEFAKALMAGSGVDAASFSGGRALAGESLQGADNRKLSDIPVNILDLVFKGFLKAVKNEKINTYEETKRFVQGHGFTDNVSDEILGFIHKKITRS